MGQVVHTLPEGPAVYGVTSLGDEVFVLRYKERDQVEVYDVITYRLVRRITIANAIGFVDMTSCEHYYCVYISDHVVRCIHRVDKQSAATRWAVDDEPTSLFVNSAHNVLVTCRVVRKIKEFSSHGDLLREMTLPNDVRNPWHSLQLATGQFIVSHGDVDDAVHRVCTVSADGREIVHSHGGQPGADSGQYNVPRHLAIDDNESVFVVDIINRRVTLLSPTLHYVRHIVWSSRLRGNPRRFCLDIQRRRLYVTDNEWHNRRYRVGRVVVFSV